MPQQEFGRLIYVAVWEREGKRTSTAPPQVYDIVPIFSSLDLNAIPKTVLILNAANAMKQAMSRKIITITAIT
jgi:hypothetical protein